jgi:hypothetical protein
MRNVISQQLLIGQTDIANIDIDVTPPNDVPLPLILQDIYTTGPLRRKVVNILNIMIPWCGLYNGGKEYRLQTLKDTLCLYLLSIMLWIMRK